MTSERAKKLSHFLLALTLLFAVTVFSLFSYRRAYAGKIYRNVFVDGVNVGGLTKVQALALIKKHYQAVLGKEITIKTSQKQMTAHLEDTGIYFNTDNIVDNSYNLGRGETATEEISGIAKTAMQKSEVLVIPSINKVRYDNFLQAISSNLSIIPTNASIKVENGVIVEVSESSGQTIDTNQIMTQVLALANNEDDKVLLVDTIDNHATVTAANFADAKNYALSVLNRDISFNYNGKSYKPTKTELGRWIDFSEDKGHFSASLDDSSVKAYLNGVGSDFEVQTVDRKINSLDNSVIVEGKAGLYLDKDNALNQLKSGLSGSAAVLGIGLIVNPVEPKEIRVVPAEGLVPGRFSGKYVDVDLAQQRLCRVEGNSVLDCFVVSTGKPSTPTPVGTRLIESKGDRVWSGAFGLWMPWWESLGGGYGIHELPEWPGGYKEGANHLGTPVSHGCIRLGVGPAKVVYDWTEIGTPVYIHK